MPPPPSQHTYLRFAYIALFLFSLFAMTACASSSKEKDKALKLSKYHYDLGVGFFSEQQIPLSIRELMLSVDANPDNPDAHHLLGFIYMGRRNYPTAIKHFKQGIALRDNFYICLNNLGAAYLAAERWEDAVALYEELTDKPTYNTPELAYNNLGWALHKLGRYKRANEAFEMATFLKPQLCLAYNNLGLNSIKQQNAIGATRAFKKAIKYCPTFVEPHFHIAQLMRVRNNPRAREFYQRCFELAAETKWGDRCRSYLEVLQ